MRSNFRCLCLSVSLIRAKPATFHTNESPPAANQRDRGAAIQRLLVTNYDTLEGRCGSGGFLRFRRPVPLGDKGRASRAAGPGQDHLFRGGGGDDAFDEAGFRFHGSVPCRSMQGQEVPLLDDQGDGPIRLICGDCAVFRKHHRGFDAPLRQLRHNSAPDYKVMTEISLP